MHALIFRKWFAAAGKSAERCFHSPEIFEHEGSFGISPPIQFFEMSDKSRVSPVVIDFLNSLLDDFPDPFVILGQVVRETDNVGSFFAIGVETHSETPLLDERTNKRPRRE